MSGRREACCGLPRGGGVYWKVTVERPLRLQGVDPERPYKANEIKTLKSRPRPPSGHSAERSETAPPVIKKVHTRGVEADPLRGLFPATIRGKSAVVKYAPDSDLRDTDQLSLTEAGGIAALRHSCTARCYPTRPTPGTGPQRHARLRGQLHSPLLHTAAAAGFGGDRADILALEREPAGLLGGIVPWEQHGR